MNEQELEPFVQWITQQLGLRIREQDRAPLWHQINQRTKATGCHDVAAYYRLLTVDQPQHAQLAEQQEFIRGITIAESYFFRDKGQFALLRETVLPQLIQLKRERQPANRQIRVWSAGCSTGEEVYSLAITLRDLLPDWNEWSIAVMGTDINTFSLQHAERGMYSDWSLRSLPPAIQSRYFSHRRDGWQINSELRHWVKFLPGNLLADPYPNVRLGIYDLDLIICRNVFIYFEPHAIAQVLTKFYRALALHGYLFTGHSELCGVENPYFQARLFPQSVVYQPRLEPANPPMGLPCPIPKPAMPTVPTNIRVTPVWPGGKPLRAPDVPPNPQQRTGATEAAPAPTYHRDLEALMAQKRFAEVMARSRELMADHAQDVQLHCLLAQASANVGDYDQATQSCQTALQISPFAIAAHHLLAQISEEQGDIETAKKILRRIIYLDPQFIPAYLDLGFLYKQEGNVEKVKTTWTSLLQLIRQNPQHLLTMSQPNDQDGDLVAFIEQQLAAF